MKKINLIVVLSLFFCVCAAGESIRGMVVDASGAAVQGARVEATGHEFRQISTTGPDGTFHFTTTAAAGIGLTLRVSASGFSTSEMKLREPLTDVRVTLSPEAVRTTVAVSARRTEAAVNETAESLTVFAEHELTTTGAFTLDDQLRQEPGFNLFRRSNSLTANPTSQGVSLRGIGANGTSRTLVLSDGVPLNDPFGGWVYWDRIPRAAIQRVELLQGGASQLYGSTALSGVIDMVAQVPQHEWLVLESSGGSRSTPEGSAFAGREFGAWSVSGSGGGYSTDGFIATPAADRGTADTPVASRDRNGMLTVAREYSGGSVRVTGLYFRESRENGTPLQTNDTNIGEGNIHWSQALAGGILQGALFGSGQSYNQSFSAVATNRNSESLTRLQHVPAQRLGGGLQWSNASRARQQWTLGGDAQSVRGFSLETGFVAGNATVKTSAGGIQRSFGFFAQDTIRATARTIVSAGLRVDHWTNNEAAFVSKALASGAVTRTPFSDREENFVSPHASLLLKLTEEWAITLAGSRSFRAPTLNELYRSFRLGNVLTNANSALNAEQLYGGEGGMVGNVRRVRLRAVGFAYRVDDPVANVTLSATPALITRQRQNLGQTSSRGVELSASADLSRHLNVQAGYQFTHSIVEDFPVDVRLVHKRIPQVPIHTFTFQAGWRSSGWSVTAQGRASGNQYDDDQNAFALGRAFTLDAMLAKQLGGVSVFVAGQNLTNDRFLTARTPTPQEAAGISGRVGIRLELPRK